MDRSLRVCHIIHSLGRGGAEHVLTDMAAVAPGVDITLSVISLMPLDDRFYADQLIARGAEIRSLDLASKWDARGLGRATNMVQELRPDVLHTHLKHADIIGAAVARRLDVPMLSTLHLIENDVSLMGYGKRWLGARARSKVAARTIAVSNAQRRWYVSTLRGDASTVVTLPNGVLRPEPQLNGARQELRRELGVADDVVIATMLGIMRPGKGHDQLIAAAGLLPHDLKVHLVLAGDGPLRPTLEAAARLVDPENRRITFAGFRHDVSRLLAGSDLVVHPTLFDALPGSLIHGLAAGLPAVASDVGGVPDVVSPDTGILVPPGDPAALATAITVLASDPTRRHCMGAAARQRFERTFDAEVWIRQLRSLYDDVLRE